LVWSPGAQTPLVGLIDSARSGTTIWAEDEQLNSQPIQQALVSAAKRGVTVNFLMTYSSDWASGLAALSQGGVHVKVYQPNAPIYIHAKALTVNDNTAYEGSANFTTAMTSQNRNVGIITKDPAVVGGIRSTIASDFAGAAPLAPGH
jgi:phosphatidylserine/phosphatidylglycerophosphate/cardiolipin synthase-like enzyme